VTLASSASQWLGEAEQEGEIAVNPFELKLLCSLDALQVEADL